MVKQDTDQPDESLGQVAGPLSKMIPVSDLSAQGRDVVINATTLELTAISSACELAAVDSLAAEFHVSKGPGALLLVEGNVKADIIQTCSISLKPIHAHVEADMVQTFTLSPVSANDEVDIAVGDDDPPEFAINGQIDFGALAFEHFILNLDPYPRAPNVQFESEDWENESDSGETARTSPFSALADLKIAAKEH